MEDRIPRRIPAAEIPYTSAGGGQFDHLEYWRNKTEGNHPPPPKDPRYWCAVHSRPLTYQEMISEERPLCSWCRAPEILEEERPDGDLPERARSDAPYRTPANAPDGRRTHDPRGGKGHPGRGGRLPSGGVRQLRGL